MTIRYFPLAGVLVTSQAIPLSSSASTVEVMSLVWRSVKVEPSVTTYCNVSTFVLSIVG